MLASEVKTAANKFLK